MGRTTRVLCLLPLLAADARTCGQESLTFQEVTFTAAVDGTRQLYVIGLPSGFNTDSAHDLLIALHGHGSDRWQYPRDARDECRATRDFGVKHRMIFVAPDYRAKTSWMGPKAEADLVQIIAGLKQQYRIGRVIVSGGSMGGSSALTFAALHPELTDGVAAANGTANHLEYENFQDAIGASFGGSKTEVPGEYKKRSAEYWPERLTMPIALTAGGKDTSVPADSVVRLAGILKKLNRPVLLLYRETGGHHTTYEDNLRVLEFALSPPTTNSPAR
jgi:pimeloyl-ACP methyl ester carboxylesterase